MTISMLKKLRYGVTSFVATITMCQAQTAKVIVSVSNLSQFERRAETVNDIKSEYQRNLQTRLFNSDAEGSGACSSVDVGLLR